MRPNSSAEQQQPLKPLKPLLPGMHSLPGSSIPTILCHFPCSVLSHWVKMLYKPAGR